MDICKSNHICWPWEANAFQTYRVIQTINQKFKWQKMWKIFYVLSSCFKYSVLPGNIRSPSHDHPFLLLRSSLEKYLCGKTSKPILWILPPCLAKSFKTSIKLIIMCSWDHVSYSSVFHQCQNTPFSILILEVINLLLGFLSVCPKLVKLIETYVTSLHFKLLTAI